jgi:hypothetical protein
MPLNVLQSCNPALYWSIGRLYNQLDNPNEILQESVKDILTFHFGQVIKEIVKGRERTRIFLGISSVRISPIFKYYPPKTV